MFCGKSTISTKKKAAPSVKMHAAKKKGANSFFFSRESATFRRVTGAKNIEAIKFK